MKIGTTELRTSTSESGIRLFANRTEKNKIKSEILVIIPVIWLKHILTLIFPTFGEITTQRKASSGSVSTIIFFPSGEHKRFSDPCKLRTSQPLSQYNLSMSHPSNQRTTVNISKQPFNKRCISTAGCMYYSMYPPPTYISLSSHATRAGYMQPRFDPYGPSMPGQPWGPGVPGGPGRGGVGRGGPGRGSDRGPDGG